MFFSNPGKANKLYFVIGQSTFRTDYNEAVYMIQRNY